MRRTDAMTVTLARPGVKSRVFTVPLALGREVETLMKRAAKASRSVPAALFFPGLADDVKRPATMLRGSRYKEGMTQMELAARLAIRQSHLSEMENGKRPIGKSMARKLAEVFACDYRVFL